MVHDIQQSRSYDVCFIIPDVHFLYKWLMIYRIQTRDKILAQLRACNNLRGCAFFLFCPAEEKLFSGEEHRGERQGVNSE